MGIVRKLRKKYVSHKNRWNKGTILDEKKYTQSYALKNKKEIRKAELVISKIKKIAKSFNKDDETKNSSEAIKFITKLKLNGFLDEDKNSLDEVLDMKIDNILRRRISNVVYQNGLASTPKQARQFIVHKHITIGDKVIDSPSYIVKTDEEDKIDFIESSILADEEHPQRQVLKEKNETIIKMEEESSTDNKEEEKEEEKSEEKDEK